MFLSGNETSRSNGVGFLVKNNLVSLIDKYEPISDRLAVLSLKTKFCNIVFLQCYFPTTDYPDEDIMEMYEEIEEIIRLVPKRDDLYVMGDFNCKVGDLHINYPEAVGKHTTGQSNTRANFLQNFAQEIISQTPISRKENTTSGHHPMGKLRIR